MEDKIEKALRSEPNFKLQDQFAERVLMKIEKKERAVALKNSLLLAGSVVLFLLLSSISLVYFLGVEQINFVLSLSRWILLAGVIVGAVQYFDNHLVKRRLTKGMI
ncbi:MAG: hypothetical protein JXR03_21435 [Cyclobacteriaceae bacterium]